MTLDCAAVLHANSHLYVDCTNAVCCAVLCLTLHVCCMISLVPRVCRPMGTRSLLAHAHALLSADHSFAMSC